MTDVITVDYYCGICKKRHDVSLPKNLAANRDSYPFPHIFLHKEESSKTLDDVDIDLLTTLFIDANMAIRGVEVKRLDGTDIISKDDFNVVVTRIMDELERWRADYARLELEFKQLKEKYDEMIGNWFENSTEKLNSSKHIWNDFIEITC